MVGRSKFVVLLLMSFAGCSAPIKPTADAGQITEPDCFVPVSLEFGSPLVGTRVEREFTLENTSNVEQVATIGMPSSPDFVVSPQGSITLAPSESRRITFAWTPRFAGGGGTIQVQPAASCAGTIVSLHGVSLERVLRWDPSTMDLGFVSPGMTATQTLTITNDSTFIVALSPLEIREGGMPSTAFAANSPMTITLQPRASAMVQVTFTPNALGARQALLNFTTNVPMQPNVAITLRGVGGGPAISVPSSVDFQNIPVGVGTSQMIDITNVGTSPTPPDPRANLKLAIPTFEVMPLNSNTDLNEVLLMLPAFEVSLAAGEHVRFTVTLTPTSTGLKSLRLTIFSNDPMTPAKVMTITANAQ
ncbi:MAG: choice-of-anchor D domain-containing protein [Archangium sp.]